MRGKLAIPVTYATAFIDFFTCSPSSGFRRWCFVSQDDIKRIDPGNRYGSADVSKRAAMLAGFIAAVSFATIWQL